MVEESKVGIQSEFIEMQYSKLMLMYLFVLQSKIIILWNGAMYKHRYYIIYTSS